MLLSLSIVPPIFFLSIYSEVAEHRTLVGVSQKTCWASYVVPPALLVILFTLLMNPPSRCKAIKHGLGFNLLLKKMEKWKINFFGGGGDDGEVHCGTSHCGRKLTFQTVRQRGQTGREVEQDILWV